MTQPKDDPKDAKREEAAAGGAALRVRWDESKLKSTYANVCNVASTREEVTLLFGTNQTWQTGQKELVVELTDRIILNPFAAKRLAVLLGKVVSEYEARFGELQIEAEMRMPGRKG